MRRKKKIRNLWMPRIYYIQIEFLYTGPAEMSWEKGKPSMEELSTEPRATVYNNFLVSPLSRSFLLLRGEDHMMFYMLSFYTR
jgi:hypothetical protein